MRSTTKLLLNFILISLLLLAACNAGEKDEPSPAADSSETTGDAEDTAAAAAGQPATASDNALQYSEDGLDIVFSGGGAKSIAQVGALKELEEQGISYRRVVGTSSGSIMALMVAAGYSADEMVAAITERTPDGKIILAKFMDVPAVLF